VKAKLNQRKRPFSWLLQGSYFWVIALGVGLVSLTSGLFTTNYFFIGFGSIFLIVGIIWAWLGWQSQFKKYSIIIPKHKIDEPTFLKRNADSIVLAIVSAIIGGIITFLFTKLTGLLP